MASSKKDASLYLRLSKDDKTSFQKLAKSYNIDVSQMIRRLVLAAYGETQLVEPALTETINEQCKELHAIGVNLNQLTRAVNMGY